MYSWRCITEYSVSYLYIASELREVCLLIVGQAVHGTAHPPTCLISARLFGRRLSTSDLEIGLALGSASTTSSYLHECLMLAQVAIVTYSMQLLFCFCFYFYFWWGSTALMSAEFAHEFWQSDTVFKFDRFAAPASHNLAWFLPLAAVGNLRIITCLKFPICVVTSMYSFYWNQLHVYLQHNSHLVTDSALVSVWNLAWVSREWVVVFVSHQNRVEVNSFTCYKSTNIIQ